MSPSCDGTSAVSFISWVWIDILITRVIGKIRWTPGPMTPSDTMPKRSRTPTWPAGITTTGLKKPKKMKIPITISSRRRARPVVPEGWTSKILVVMDASLRTWTLRSAASLAAPVGLARVGPTCHDARP